MPHFSCGYGVLFLCITTVHTRSDARRYVCGVSAYLGMHIDTQILDVYCRVSVYLCASDPDARMQKDTRGRDTPHLSCGYTLLYLCICVLTVLYLCICVLTVLYLCICVRTVLYLCICVLTVLYLCASERLLYKSFGRDTTHLSCGASLICSEREEASEMYQCVEFQCRMWSLSLKFRNGSRTQILFRHGHRKYQMAEVTAHRFKSESLFKFSGFGRMHECASWRKFNFFRKTALLHFTQTNTDNDEFGPRSRLCQPKETWGEIKILQIVKLLSPC